MINARVELRDEDDDLLAVIRIDEDGTVQTDGIDVDLLLDIAVIAPDSDGRPIEPTERPYDWLATLPYVFRNPYRHAVFIPE